MKHTSYFIITLLLLSGLLNAQSPLTEKQFDRTMDSRINSIVNSIAPSTIPDRTITLSKFAGHAGDETGSYNFYQDIKSAIDSLSKLGGGTLLFTHSKGVEAFVKQTEIYRVRGPIILKSNIELKFQPNLKLYFEFSPAHYLPNNKPVLTRYEGTSLYSFCPLIYAFNAENIAISFTGGNGAMPVIDGDGERWQKWFMQGNDRVKAKGLTVASSMVRTHFNKDDVPLSERICADTAYHFLRPALMQFIHCQKIKIDGVKLVNSPFWTVHPVFSTDIVFRNVMYDCQVFNNDGIDIESSSRVLVENVIFDNHDDNIVIKSGRDSEGRDGVLVKGTEYEQINSNYIRNGRMTAPTSEVVVRNCVFKGHNSVCVGSEIAGGANNIYVTDCFSPLEVEMGIFLKSSRQRGGVVSDIYLRN
ncbi:MAG: glycoside hydrolase family 28 protein, partial [Bacteroidales bacterium]